MIKICNMVLERICQGIQFCNWKLLNQNSYEKIKSLQNFRICKLQISRLLVWSPKTNSHSHAIPWWGPKYIIGKEMLASSQVATMWINESKASLRFKADFISIDHMHDKVSMIKSLIKIDDLSKILLHV